MAKSQFEKDPNKLFNTGAITGETAFDFIFSEKKIKEAVNKIAASNTNAIIHGDAGVGKTSFAWQMFSIFNKTNIKYNKDSLFVVPRSSEYKCVFIKCEISNTDVYDLLLSLIRPSLTKHSFSTVFKEVYNNKEVNSRLEARFHFNLFGLLDVEIASLEKDDRITFRNPGKILSSKAQILALFEQLIQEIKNFYESNIEILIFIDEIDRLPIKTGLGSLVKNANDCKFIFIGIAETITQLFQDHPSTLRKFIGTAIEIEPLTEDQIEWIFRVATNKSNGGVSFTPEFIFNVRLYSGGYPWIAQNTGFQALMNRLIVSNDKLHQTVVDESYFNEALKTVIESYKDQYSLLFDLQKGLSSASQKAVAKIIWDQPNVSEQEIRIKIKALSLPAATVSQSIQRLRESKILKETGKNTFNFINPVVRVLIKHFLDTNRQ